MTTPNRRPIAFCMALAVLSACGGSFPPHVQPTPLDPSGDEAFICGDGLAKMVCGAAASIAVHKKHLKQVQVRQARVAAAGEEDRYIVHLTLQNGKTRRVTVAHLLTGEDAVAWTWKEAADYSFTADLSSMAIFGGFRIDVRDGDVVRARTESGEKANLKMMPTIGVIKQRAEDAVARGGNVAVLLAADGRPVFVSMDPMLNAIDDESSVWITHYRPR